MVAARPGMGKTMFALNIVHSNIRKGIRCAYVCLEETASHLIFMLLAQNADIPAMKLRKGLLNEGEWDKLAKAVYSLEKAPLYILERGDLSFDKLMCELWEVSREGRARLREYSSQAIRSVKPDRLIFTVFFCRGLLCHQVV